MPSREGVEGLGRTLCRRCSLHAHGRTAAAAAPTFTARGSVEQVYVTGARPGAQMSLLNSAGKTVATRKANSLGGVLFRNVPPGSGYRVRPSAGGDGLGPADRALDPAGSAEHRRLQPDDPLQRLRLSDHPRRHQAVHVRAPAAGRDEGAARTSQLPPVPAGPTPTLIEYSGYGYADPAGPQSGISILANLMGFTVVDVNMRGTGCSGGAFDFFEPLQSLDGYDVVETIARQPWVLHNKVGMMGISYGGISQLFTAQTNPPSLAAISPLSVIDSTQTTLYPGGILNTGFAVAWAQERIHDAQAASPTGGQPWAYKRIQEGDATCKANQDLHPEAVDLMAKIRANDHYVPSVADPLSPVTFVNKIKVPMFMACQWTDEQTGGHCPTWPKHFTGTNRKWFTFTNGTHVDSLDPETFNRWYDFLQLYVAQAGADRELRGDPRRRAGDLPGGDGDHGRDDAARPDPAAAHLRDRAGGVRAAAVDPRPLRQRRGRPAAGPPGPRLRALVAELPDPGHHGPVVVPGAERRARRRAARGSRQRTRSPGTRTPGR